MMKVEIFYADNSSFDSIKKDVGKKYRKTLDLSTIEPYSYAVTIMYMHYKETDTTECL